MRAFPCIIPLAIYFYLISSIFPYDFQAIHSVSQAYQESSPAEEASEGSRSPKQNKGYKVGITVDLVMIYVSVFDKNGHFVSGLEKEKFKLFEDGAAQETTYFSQVDLPITLGITLDLSGSMEGKIDQVNKAARAFIEASNPNDQIFLIGFNDQVELLKGFTSDIDEISDALENAFVMGGTALYDAIYLGVEEAHRGDKSKKAIIVITDGEDKDSTYSLEEIISFVQESDVQIFNIGFLDEIPSRSLFGRWFKSDEEKARDALRRISKESGGEAYFPANITDIHGIVSEIASELRNQYSIGYFSKNDKRDGSWRRVVVKLDTDAVEAPQIRHRLGYYAPKE